jgi:hypothetical protein
LYNSLWVNIAYSQFHTCSKLGIPFQNWRPQKVPRTSNFRLFFADRRETMDFGVIPGDEERKSVCSLNIGLQGKFFRKNVSNKFKWSVYSLGLFVSFRSNLFFTRLYHYFKRVHIEFFEGIKLYRSKVDWKSKLHLKLIVV